MFPCLSINRVLAAKTGQGSVVWRSGRVLARTASQDNISMLFDGCPFGSGVTQWYRSSEFRNHSGSSFATFAKAPLSVQPALPKPPVRAARRVFQQESHRYPPQMGLIPLPGAALGCAVDTGHFHNTTVCLPTSCQYPNAASCRGVSVSWKTSSRVQGRVLEERGVSQCWDCSRILLCCSSVCRSLWLHRCLPLASPLRFLVSPVPP